MWQALLKTALQKYGPTVASAVGSMAAGKSAGRAQTNNFNADSDRTALTAQGQEENAAQNRARLEMDQKESQRAALNDAYKNAMKSSLAMNMQDSSVGALPKGVPSISFSGGARPSAMGTQGRDAAKAMNNSAMQSLLNPDELTTLAPQRHFNATPMKEAGAMENIMGTVGLAGSAVDQFGARQQEAQNNSLVQQIIAAQRKQQAQSASGVGGNDLPLGNPTA
jgi:hypothetical protein